jgi:hypothetical protein
VVPTKPAYEEPEMLNLVMQFWYNRATGQQGGSDAIVYDVVGATLGAGSRRSCSHHPAYERDFSIIR